MLTSWVPLCATSLAVTSKRDRLPHTQFRVAWQARRARTLRHALAVLWTHALVRDEALQCTAVMTVACRDQPMWGGSRHSTRRVRRCLVAQRAVRGGGTTIQRHRQTNTDARLCLQAFCHLGTVSPCFTGLWSISISLKFPPSDPDKTASKGNRQRICAHTAVPLLRV